ncbi:MAG: hypothetical protein ACOCYE_07960 [Pseudomonadota bacterium]
MREDQLFQLVALLSIALFIGSGVLPLPPGMRRLARQGAILVLGLGLLAAIVLIFTGG